MRRRLNFLLLSAGLVVCRLQADDVVRHFTVVSLKMSWTDAQQYCRAKFTDLATIPDKTSNADARQVAEKGKYWIGLFNTSWRWSLENQDVSNTNWAPGEPGSGFCVTISVLGFWSTRDCSELYRFSCYSAATNSHILMQMMMNWTDAQVYCRSSYTDMSSIRTSEGSTQISSLLQHNQLQPTAATTETEKDNGTSGSSDVVHPPEAWIGLYRYFWGWSDRSDATYRQWGRNQPSGGVNCVILDTASSSWYTQNCEDKFSFLCYTSGTYSELKTMKLRLRGGSADLNDLVLRDSILQQLKQKLQDGGIPAVKLRWRKQPGGNVFHRTEEASAPPCGQEEKEDACDFFV